MSVKTEINTYVKNKTTGEVEYTFMEEVEIKARELFGENSNLAQALSYGYYGHPVKDDDLIELSKHFPDLEFRVFYKPEDDEIGIYSCKNGMLVDGKVIYKFYNFE